MGGLARTFSLDLARARGLAGSIISNLVVFPGVNDAAENG